MMYKNDFDLSKLRIHWFNDRWMKNIRHAVWYNIKERKDY